jgi:hypothetical protein
MTCSLLLAVAVCCLPAGVGADDVHSVADDLRAPFALQYVIQSGDRLLAPADRDVPRFDESAADDVLPAGFWEAAASSSDASPAPAKADAAEESETVADAASEGLFQSMSSEGSDHWSTALDSAAENRVDSAIRAAGFAVALLGIALMGFLGWHRMRGTKLSAPAETSELLERGRLPITPTCRLHLVRAGGCDVLVAVDRGAVRAMTPLPGDFSQLTAMPFDATDPGSAHDAR